MRIAFRGDSSSIIGTGHIMRCLNIARAGDLFICRKLDGNIISVIKERGIEVKELDSSITEEEDGIKTLEIIKREKIERIVVDHYGLGNVFTEIIKKSGAKAAVIDDLGEREIAGDLIINQNPYGKPEMYVKSGEKGIKLCAGAEYTMLRDEFWRQKSEYKVSKNIKKILITMGGGDSDNITGKICDYLSDEDYIIKLVLGKANIYKESLKEKYRGIDKIEIVENIKEMRPIFEWADFVISAGGTTIWELIYMGVPFGVVETAYNQKLGIEYISKNRLGIIFGAGDKVEKNEVLEKIRDYSFEKRVNDSKANKTLINGKGGEKIREAIELM